jgi:hypothetical protein
MHEIGRRFQKSSLILFSDWRLTCSKFMEQNLAQIEIKDIQDAKLMSQVNIFDKNFHLYTLVYVYLLGRKNFLFNVTKEKKIPFQCESSLSSHSLSSISACHQVNELQSTPKEFFGNQRSHDALP